MWPRCTTANQGSQLECLSSTSFTMKPEDKQRTEQHQDFTKIFDAAVPHNILRKLLKQSAGVKIHLKVSKLATEL